jgi:hypothetical protein
MFRAERNTPPWKGGCPRLKQYREATFVGADGVVRSRDRPIPWLEQPPRPRRLKRLRAIFFMAQPYLGKEGCALPKAGHQFSAF